MNKKVRITSLIKAVWHLFYNDHAIRSNVKIITWYVLSIYSVSLRQTSFCFNLPQLTAPSAQIQTALSRTLRGAGLQILHSTRALLLSPSNSPSPLCHIPLLHETIWALGILSESDPIRRHDQRHAGLCVEVWSHDIYLHSEGLRS